MKNHLNEPTHTTPQSTQVLVVGAGPTGLTAAIWLAQSGIQVRIIDKNKQRVSTSNALALHSRSLELLDRVGVTDQLLAHGQKIDHISLYDDHKCLGSNSFETLPSFFNYSLTLPQSDIEAILEEKLNSLNVQVERQQCLSHLQQNEQGVVATINEQTTLSAEWLIGADGYRSEVRKQCGIEFAGGDLKAHFILADVELKGDLDQQQIHAFLSSQGPLLFVPLRHQLVRMIAEVKNPSDDTKSHMPSLSECQQLIEQRINYPLLVAQLRWSSRFWIHSRQALSYKQGQVLLAGDAAHVHSPVGGQGMNTGIQDAVNLSWKLARVLKVEDKKSLLDSYELERSPVAKKVVQATQQATRMITMKYRWLQKLRNQLIHWLLKSSKIKHELIHVLSELDVHYDLSPWIYEDVTYADKNFIHGPKAGMRAPNNHQAKSTDDLYQQLIPLQFNGLIFKGLDKKSRNWQQIQQQYAEQYPHAQMHFIDDPFLNHLYGCEQPGFYLIRPDLYIAFRQPIRDGGK